MGTDVAALSTTTPFGRSDSPVCFNLAGFGYQSELELRVAEAARRQYNKLKMQTKAEIRQTLDRLLVGDFIVSGCTSTLLRGWGRGRYALCQVLYLFWMGMLVSVILIKLKL